MSSIQPFDPNTKILNDNHLAAIQESLSRLDWLDKQLALAKQAGFNVDAQIQTAANSRDQLLKVKNTYFPGR